MAAKYVQNCSKKSKPSLKFAMRFYLLQNYYPFSRVNTYCLVTGRTRFTVTLTHTSRHIFFDFCRGGDLTGFFYSSN